MIPHIHLLQTILYVSDQERSTAFYSLLFRCSPDLHVPGMTEFVINNTCKIGLMPNAGIAKILQQHLPHPDKGNGIPRCELYLYIDEVQQEFDHAVSIGAQVISLPAARDWGDEAFYIADPDGHVIAFAKRQL